MVCAPRSRHGRGAGQPPQFGWAGGSVYCRKLDLGRGVRIISDPVFNPFARDSNLSRRTENRQKSPGLRAAYPVYEHAHSVTSSLLCSGVTGRDHNGIICREGGSLDGRRVGAFVWPMGQHDLTGIPSAHLPLVHHALFPFSRGWTYSEGRGEDGKIGPASRLALACLVGSKLEI